MLQSWLEFQPAFLIDFLHFSAIHRIIKLQLLFVISRLMDLQHVEHDQTEYIKNILNADRADLDEIFRSIKEKEVLSENINDNYDETTTFGQRLADKIASFGGSWTFIISFLVILGLWMGLNIVL